MKKICLILTMVFMLFACSNGVGYERNTSMATLNNTDWETVMDRIDNDETLMFMVTFDGCPSCEYFVEKVLTGYMRNHGFELNLVNFTKDDWDNLSEQATAFVRENPYTEEELNKFKYYDYTEEDRQVGALLTPTLFFIQDGEVKDKLFSGNITVEDLDAMIVKYRLDEKK